MIPITSSVKPEPRTPAIHADEGGAGGCFGRGVRGADAARGAEGVREPEAPRFFPADDVPAAGRAGLSGT
ncbi:hypothetical protein, partial [Rathayibacter sp. AY1A2]|uniref:hypothetical protein n=1 Tax=Rathayibacter sp. AY1A2 TaxID=2080520 RepID=UPI0015E2D5A1